MSLSTVPSHLMPQTRSSAGQDERDPCIRSVLPQECSSRCASLRWRTVECILGPSSVQQGGHVLPESGCCVLPGYPTQDGCSHESPVFKTERGFFAGVSSQASPSITCSVRPNAMAVPTNRRAILLAIFIAFGELLSQPCCRRRLT